MKWKVQLVKKEIIVPAGANEKYKYSVPCAGKNKLVYTIIAQQGCQAHLHFELGSLDETKSGTTELLIQLQLLAKNAYIKVTAAVVTGKNQIHTLTTEQLHTAPDTQSSVSIKAVVKEGGTHDYRSIIRLESNSLRADARQQNKILLLGSGAKVTSEPTLQILHDDVQCAHGTAISQIDPEQLFYWASRGLVHHLAQRLIVKAVLSNY